MGFGLASTDGRSLWNTRSEGWMLFRERLARLAGATVWAERYAADLSGMFDGPTKEAALANIPADVPRVFFELPYKQSMFAWTWRQCGGIARWLQALRPRYASLSGVDEEDMRHWETLVTGLLECERMHRGARGG
jgi:hypothetical protein